MPSEPIVVVGVVIITTIIIIRTIIITITVTVFALRLFLLLGRAFLFGVDSLLRGCLFFVTRAAQGTVRFVQLHRLFFSFRFF